MSKKYHGKYLEVRWDDACSIPSWTPAGTPVYLTHVVSVGQYVQHDKRRFILALNQDENDTYGDLIVIPTVQITKIRVLRRPAR